MNKLSWLRPPETNYRSLNDIGKFKMIWNVSLVLVPVFFVLFIAHLIFGDNSWLTSISATLVGFFNIVYMRVKRRYDLIGVLAIFLGSTIVQISIWLLDDSRLIPDTMWCVMIGIFTYFIFGRIIGTLTLVANLTGLVLFLQFGSESIILKKSVELTHGDFKMIFNVFYVALALAFIISKIIKDNSDIQSSYEQEIKRNETLLKEIHHRVKNNLQIVSSLLNLQAKEAGDQKTEENFNEAINRVRAMALIHERMYQREDLSHIDFEDYVVRLAADITSAIASNSNIEVNVDSKVDDIQVKNIVPVSLIFNELITNSVKHGFRGQNNGKIDVKLYDSEDKVIIDYQDNGTWKDIGESNGFGLELIDSLVEQLDGEYQRTFDEEGTHYRFIFK